jgi:hypothetical protein
MSGLLASGKSGQWLAELDELEDARPHVCGLTLSHPNVYLQIALPSLDSVRRLIDALENVGTVGCEFTLGNAMGGSLWVLTLEERLRLKLVERRDLMDRNEFPAMYEIALDLKEKDTLLNALQELVQDLDERPEGLAAGGRG